MCIFGKTKSQRMPDVPEPNKVAEPQEIGGQRSVEDQALFGQEGQSLRVNREAIGSSTAGGTGLRMM